ncbi:hypothetical protein SAMN06264365_11564 [Actinoplanes regularis]|uniref:Uncharacterized protein n=1 Tax=Actinoplanes regularis TaxID=52697 RepID=A0A239E9Q0_9ACTN|nr:hypothetical protein Are01nite_57280 [Actinoplanes regularis]SNS41181.1 hypothetical protein SAMN06264365_11564 [Actinoplanes regularis]
MRQGSGGDRATGWVTRFYPYLGERDQPNPLLDRPIDDMTEPGIVSDDATATLSRVKVLYEDLRIGTQTLLALNAGLIAVVQDTDGSLRPIAGCHLTRSGPELSDVLDRVEREGRMGEPAEYPPYVDTPVLTALYGRFESGALFDGAWRLRPFDTSNDLGGHWWIAPVFDLSDGRSLCVVGEFASDRNYWTIAHWADRKLVDDPAGLRVFGQSLAELLEVALDTGGDVTHLDSGALSDYLEM